METKTLNPGDSVKLLTKTKEWEGWILESYDPSVVLIKLKSGYNIGIREKDILNVKVIEKNKGKLKNTISLKQDKKLPNVALIVTGGTISARLDPKTGGTTWTTIDDLFSIAPELREICNIVRIEKPFLKASENMAFQDWAKIADVAEKLLNTKNISGIIITHGTDFLHYSSSALSFFLKDLNKPVALTYSQRSIDRGSTDAALNLVCSARYAISDIAEVAIIGHKDLNDKTCLAMPGTKTRKMHTSRRDAFKIINSEPLAEITKDNLEILREFNARSDKRVEIDSKYSEKVALIKIYPGQNPDILDFYTKKGFKGLVLELSGLGHVPSSEAKHDWVMKIKQLIKKGITICGAPQTIHGRLNPKVYSHGRELEKTGLIFLEDMLPETALIKLAWVLGHKNWTKIKEKMLENIAGELNPKLSF